MRFDENADLDTSRIDDLRSGGGGGGGIGGRVALGGGGLGIVGLLLFLLISFLGGGGGPGGGGGGLALPNGLSALGAGQTADNTEISKSCRTGADANTKLDCEVTAVVNSLDGYWSDYFARSGQTLQLPRTNFFNGQVSTGGCGGATSDVGPFYCPADSEIYIDLSFFKELETRFGARGGPFARAYVLAHEYGHHIQNTVGTSRQVRTGGSGPTSGSVRLELQADCYAGVWANHATSVPTAGGRPLILDVNQADVAAALDTAERIGDDFIQSNLGSGRVDPGSFTHGTSAQRERWYTTGYKTGDPARCDTFRTNNLG